MYATTGRVLQIEPESSEQRAVAIPEHLHVRYGSKGCRHAMIQGKNKTAIRKGRHGRDTARLSKRTSHLNYAFIVLVSNADAI